MKEQRLAMKTKNGFDCEKSLQIKKKTRKKEEVDQDDGVVWRQGRER